MTTYVALLRAINVGGRSKVQMSDLKEGFVAAGCRQVGTYIQSGNVIFKAPEAKLAAITERVDREVQRLLGEKLTIVYRTIEQIEDIVRGALRQCLGLERDSVLYYSTTAASPPHR